MIMNDISCTVLHCPQKKTRPSMAGTGNNGYAEGAASKAWFWDGAPG